MNKIVFFWASGTAYAIDLFGIPFIGVPTGIPPVTVYGLNGQSAQWDGWPATDPFSSFLNPDAWTVKHVAYPAALFPGDSSLTKGVNNLKLQISALAPGTPFCLGGYSQGAAVCTQVLKELQTGSLTSRMTDFKGAVMFGNPCRKTDALWPAFGQYQGGLWSGSWDVANSTTGGRGCFPASYRATSVPETWFEFVGGRAANGNIRIDWINSTGDSSQGSILTNWLADALELDLPQIIAAGFNQTITNVLHLTVGGNVFDGHGAYAGAPPPGYSSTAPTSYQIALEYLESIAAENAVAPILLPSSPSTTNSAAWSTTLIPPAA